MSKLSVMKEIFQLYTKKRKFYMFPIIILLFTLMGVTALTQIWPDRIYLSDIKCRHHHLDSNPL